MRKVILDEEKIKQLESILGEIPFKWSSPIMQILGQGLTTEETATKPIGGGASSGGPRKPKDE